MRLVGALACAAAVAGCGSSVDVYYAPVGVPATITVSTVTIDTDKVVPPDDPGMGVGLFVDYASGGIWRLRTTCDVLVDRPCYGDPAKMCKPPPCPWDIVATTLSGPLDVGTAELDPEDRVYRLDDGAIRLMFDTAAEIDGVRLIADPGEKVKLDVYFDYIFDSTKLIWTSENDTVEKGGAPSNPVVFEPTVP